MGEGGDCLGAFPFGLLLDFWNPYFLVPWSDHATQMKMWEASLFSLPAKL